jgi:ubiquinone/menaquinone biosynthesis C-methylase UbiE
MTERDLWAEWLISRRDGGDPAMRAASLRQLAVWRDLILDGAHLHVDDHLLDVGTGEGLVGFGALQRLGERGRVTFSDISTDLLDVCRAAADELHVRERCGFVQAPADDLSPIADGSVDVVTTRSVLIYVAAKDRAFSEFHRVLGDGGRLSLFEPINRHMFPGPPDEFMGYSASGVEDLVAKIQCARGSWTDATGPMLDFDDATLEQLAEGAGFSEIEVTLRRRRSVEPVPMTWERFLDSSPNPLVPSWNSVLERLLTPSERTRFSKAMQPRVDVGRRTIRHALATVTAIKA